METDLPFSAAKGRQSEAAKFLPLPWLLPLLFCFGGVGYAGLEILWRGYTHWSMGIAGGICLCLLFFLSEDFRKLSYGNFLLRCLLGALSITAVEFSIGCLVNLGLHWKVWDYSALPLNLLGQICLPYTGLWFLLSVPVIFLCGLLKGKLRRKRISSCNQSTNPV